MQWILAYAFISYQVLFISPQIQLWNHAQLLGWRSSLQAWLRGPGREIERSSVWAPEAGGQPRGQLHQSGSWDFCCCSCHRGPTDTLWGKMEKYLPPYSCGCCQRWGGGWRGWLPCMYYWYRGCNAGVLARRFYSWQICRCEGEEDRNVAFINNSTTLVYSNTMCLLLIFYTV